MTRIAETRSQRSLAEIPKETGISLSSLERYGKKASGEGLIKLRRARRHVTRGASASEIRKALGISKKDLDAARRDLAVLGFKNKHP